MRKLEAEKLREDPRVAEAEKLGANAIVGVRFTTSMVMSGAAEMMAYGTAVKVE